MFRLFIFFIIVLFLAGCGTSKQEKIDAFVKNHSSIECDDEGCRGEYEGPEFKFGEDVAHQFSNLMCDRVGKKLKQLYRNGKYNRVNLDQIGMSTKGMGSGRVKYHLSIPFWPQSKKCNATTAFDHCGGWGHRPDLIARLKELQKELLPNDYPDISYRHRTLEGLQEYFIQWRHKEVQKDCND